VPWRPSAKAEGVAAPGARWAHRPHRAPKRPAPLPDAQHRGRGRERAAPPNEHPRLRTRPALPRAKASVSPTPAPRSPNLSHGAPAPGRGAVWWERRIPKGTQGTLESVLDASPSPRPVRGLRRHRPRPSRLAPHPGRISARTAGAHTTTATSSTGNAPDGAVGIVAIFHERVCQLDWVRKGRGET